jgi:hypothetical protein
MVGGERERPPRELGIAGVAPDRMRVRIGREPRVVVPERAEPVPFPAPWVANSFDASTSNLDAWSFAELAPTCTLHSSPSTSTTREFVSL